MSKLFIPRDISWLSFNARVLQEANDPSVPLKERIRFLGIYSNNSDEFFRVRVATLKRMIEYAEKRKLLNMHLEENPQLILEQIHSIVLKQQNEFNRIWDGIVKELKEQKVVFLTDKRLTKDQQIFVRKYFDDQVRSNVIPLMIESIPQLPYLREKSIYLGVVMRNKESSYHQKYALIEVPVSAVGRFVLLPERNGVQPIMLLEDIIRFNLPNIFSYFDYDHFSAHIFKVTKDAELDIDNEVASTFVERFDVMITSPYHSFNSVIDLLREAAMEPDVISIKITAYRLASISKIINALINASRNGKDVTVMLELKARFDEEANLEWKKVLEEEGVKVLLGVPKMKIHAKICVIKKKVNKKIIQYGFVSTGNLNENTARIYGDYCLLTSNRNIMADINRIFNYLENWKNGNAALRACKTLLISPVNMRIKILDLIQNEIKNAKAGKKAGIILKSNSLSDKVLIEKLYEAARSGVEIQLIIRGIFCARVENKKFIFPIKAISIVDEYLEHGRVMLFHNKGNEIMYTSSADWMVRNLDHRVEVAVPVLDKDIRDEIKAILEIQLKDNVKARVLDNNLSNDYIVTKTKKKIRSQVETYNYLYNKTITL